jgi:hypothetical protein
MSMKIFKICVLLLSISQRLSLLSGNQGSSLKKNEEKVPDRKTVVQVKFDPSGKREVGEDASNIDTSNKSKTRNGSESNSTQNHKSQKDSPRSKDSSRDKSNNDSLSAHGKPSDKNSNIGDPVEDNHGHLDEERSDKNHFGSKSDQKPEFGKNYSKKQPNDKKPDSPKSTAIKKQPSMSQSLYPLKHVDPNDDHHKNNLKKLDEDSKKIEDELATLLANDPSLSRRDDPDCKDNDQNSYSDKNSGPQDGKFSTPKSKDNQNTYLPKSNGMITDPGLEPSEYFADSILNGPDDDDNNILKKLPAKGCDEDNLDDSVLPAHLMGPGSSFVISHPNKEDEEPYSSLNRDNKYRPQSLLNSQNHIDSHFPDHQDSEADPSIYESQFDPSYSTSNSLSDTLAPTIDNSNPLSNTLARTIDHSSPLSKTLARTIDNPDPLSDTLARTIDNSSNFNDPTNSNIEIDNLLKSTDDHLSDVQKKRKINAIRANIKSETARIIKNIANKVALSRKKAEANRKNGSSGLDSSFVSGEEASSELSSDGQKPIVIILACNPFKGVQSLSMITFLAALFVIVFAY